MKQLIIFLTIINSFFSWSQQKEYIKFDYDGFKFPILVRGNINSGKLLLFVQGGPGETAIDFARSNYPKWKKTLEKEVAIAYYDQRGLNLPSKKIDESKITYDQYSKDIFAIAEMLSERYEAQVYLIGHSAGGYMVLHTFQYFIEKSSFFAGAIIVNTPITSDHSVERYQYYRPLYLKNLANEKVSRNENVDFWQKELDWITSIDSITTQEEAIRWNRSVEQAFEGTKRKLTPGMAIKVIFSRPYNPFKYMCRKDNEKVDDLLWEDRKNTTSFENLSKIEGRLLMITGRYDDIAPPEELIVADSLIQNSKLAVLPHAAHESYLDQPELFNDAVLKFVEK